MRKLSLFKDLRTVSFIVALILAIPGLWKGFTGFYTWLSPFIMLNSVFATRTFVLMNIVAGAVLLFILFRRRWFCRNLCPAGWCFDKISLLNKSGSKNFKRVPDIGKWLAIISLVTAFFGLPLFVFLDPMALFNGFFTGFAGGFSAVSQDLHIKCFLHLYWFYTCSIRVYGVQNYVPWEDFRGHFSISGYVCRGFFPVIKGST